MLLGREAGKILFNAIIDFHSSCWNSVCICNMTTHTHTHHISNNDPLSFSARVHLGIIFLMFLEPISSKYSGGETMTHLLFDIWYFRTKHTRKFID